MLIEYGKENLYNEIAVKRKKTRERQKTGKGRQPMGRIYRQSCEIGGSYKKHGNQICKRKR